MRAFFLAPQTKSHWTTGLNTMNFKIDLDSNTNSSSFCHLISRFEIDKMRPVCIAESTTWYTTGPASTSTSHIPIPFLPNWAFTPLKMWICAMVQSAALSFPTSKFESFSVLGFWKLVLKRGGIMIIFPMVAHWFLQGSLKFPLRFPVTPCPCTPPLSGNLQHMRGTLHWLVITCIYPPSQRASHHQDGTTFLVGNSYKPQFVLVTGWKLDPSNYLIRLDYTHKVTVPHWKGTMSRGKDRLPIIVFHWLSLFSGVKNPIYRGLVSTNLHGLNVAITQLPNNRYCGFAMFMSSSINIPWFKSLRKGDFSNPLSHNKNIHRKPCRFPMKLVSHPSSTSG